MIAGSEYCHEIRCIRTPAGISAIAVATFSVLGVDIS
jgi:hypothetical protein